MTIETVDDLCNQIADWVGVYGCCKQASGYVSDECTDKNPICCRVGFVMELRERMINAVDNDKKLEKIGL